MTGIYVTANDGMLHSLGFQVGVGQEEITVSGAEPLVDKTSVRSATTLVGRNIDAISEVGVLVRPFGAQNSAGEKVANTFESTGRGKIGGLTGPPDAFGVSFGTGLKKSLSFYGSVGAFTSASNGGQFFALTPFAPGGGVAIGTDAPTVQYSFTGTNRWDLRWSLRLEPPLAGTKGSFVGVVSPGLTFAGANGGIGTTFGIGLNYSIGWVNDPTTTGSTLWHRYTSDAGLTTFTPTVLPQFASLTYILQIELATYRQAIVDNTSDAVVDDTGFIPFPSPGFLSDYKDYTWGKETTGAGLTLNVGFSSAWGE